MSVHYIIDAYNIINNRLFAVNCKKTIPVQLALLQLIKDNRLCGSEKNQVTVVFDGYSAEFESKCLNRGIKVLFSRGETADAVIKHIIDFSVNLKNIIVVSEDKEISSFAKYAGCKTMDVCGFMGKMAAADANKNVDKKEKNLPKQDLNYTQINKINDELKKLWLSDK